MTAVFIKNTASRIIVGPSADREVAISHHQARAIGVYIVIVSGNSEPVVV